MTITLSANKGATGMKLISLERIIKKAANSVGDSVTFLERMENREEIIYEVVLHNSRTGQPLNAHCTAIPVRAFARERLERAAQVACMVVFVKACRFMGIESGLEE